MPRVLLCVPTYDGSLDYRHVGSYRAFLESGVGAPWPEPAIAWERGSALCLGFNKLFRIALDMRDRRGVTHFCLLHADVGVEGKHRPWPLEMLDLMDEHDLPVLSVTVPIKDNSGHTSVAVEVAPDVQHRLPLAEIAGKTITSRDEPNLLINTGCLMIDLSQPWADDVCFQTRDYLDDDKRPVFCPEDWEFSRWLRDRGIAYGTTGEVIARHVGGRCEFHNTGEMRVG